MSDLTCVHTAYSSVTRRWAPQMKTGRRGSKSFFDPLASCGISLHLFPYSNTVDLLRISLDALLLHERDFLIGRWSLPHSQDGSLQPDTCA